MCEIYTMRDYSLSPKRLEEIRQECGGLSILKVKDKIRDKRILFNFLRGEGGVVDESKQGAISKCLAERGAYARIYRERCGGTGKPGCGPSRALF